MRISRHYNSFTFYDESIYIHSLVQSESYADSDKWQRSVKEIQINFYVIHFYLLEWFLKKSLNCIHCLSSLSGGEQTCIYFNVWIVWCEAISVKTQHGFGR